MRKKVIDKNMPVGKLTRVDDFLPSPEQLAVSEATVKITLALKKSSVEFFKQQAEQNHTKYQKMIRELVDRYANRYACIK